jgi:hypothetical protein
MGGVVITAAAVAPPCAGLSPFRTEDCPRPPRQPCRSRVTVGRGSVVLPRAATAVTYFEVRFWTVSASKSESFSTTELSYGLSSLPIAVTK